MNLISRFFKKADRSGYTYQVDFTLDRAYLDHWLGEVMTDIQSKVFKRLEDDMYNKLKEKIVSDDLLTTQVLNELRLVTAKRLIEK